MTMKTQQLKTYGMQKSSSKSIAIQSYLKKQEKYRIDNLTLHLSNWKKKRTTTTKNSKISRRKEIIKIRAEITEKEMKETIAKISKTNWFFEKINKHQPDSSRKREDAYQ